MGIITSASSLKRSSLGSITGILAVRLEDFVFPDENWSDFPVVVLGWWLEAALALQAAGEGRFRFMDGPFEFVVSSRPGVASRATFERQHARGADQLHSAPVDAAALPREITRAARDVVRECLKRGWSDDGDLGRLSQVIN
jgi:hypothetical protein